ncbi:MAG TPA: class I SAM-dependent methyltransferase [Thermodesulfobacteriota bacterium]
MSTGNYDTLSWFYERHWGPGFRFYDFAMDALEPILLRELRGDARILDLCCGAGHIVAALSERGYLVVGADLSVEMLKLARSKSPQAGFFAADAREFSTAMKFDAVVSTFDSINHILDPADLALVFGNVSEALAPGGLFVFDLLEEEAYTEAWAKSGFFLEEDNACIIRGSYDERSRIARVDLTLFRLENGWTRSDVSVFERYYPADEVAAALESCGFERPQVYRSKADFHMPVDAGVGRVFIKARKVLR